MTHEEARRKVKQESGCTVKGQCDSCDEAAMKLLISEADTQAREACAAIASSHYEAAHFVGDRLCESCSAAIEEEIRATIGGKDVE